ncbi:MAG: hypothetical protein HY586_03800 [Candidatus Omnitrophica bacterium]|nr:hypothetical protein [Candidatus Omnitrophota bacterium]
MKLFSKTWVVVLLLLFAGFSAAYAVGETEMNEIGQAASEVDQETEDQAFDANEPDSGEGDFFAEEEY